MVVSLQVIVLALLLFGSVPVCPASLQRDFPLSSLASITVDVQTFGRPRADFPATIQIHSPALESDLSATSDKPSSVNFPNLPPGQYHIAVTAPSREPANLEVKLVSGQTAKLSVIVDRIFPLTLSLDRISASAESATLKTESAAAPAVLPGTVAPLALAQTLDPTSPAAAAPATPNVDASEESTPPTENHDIPSPSSASPPPPHPLQPFVTQCSIDDVIPRVSSHVQEFVESINRITATEFMNFERRNNKGRVEEKAQNKVSYVATIEALESGFLSVDEYRNGAPGMSGFQGHIASTGSAAMVLIFHPTHLNEFAMACQGLLIWHDVPAYKISFEQRLDRPNTMSEFRAGNMSYAILLKGTAWVDPENFQILHIETDLVKPIPEVILDAEHQSIDYGPVAFSAHNDNLWLPQVADITVVFRHKEFSERHSYTDYRLFTVETGQKISKPTVASAPD